MRDPWRAWSLGSAGRGAASRGRERPALVASVRPTKHGRVEWDIRPLRAQRCRAAPDECQEIVPTRGLGLRPGIALVLKREHIDRLHKVVMIREHWNISG